MSAPTIAAFSARSAEAAGGVANKVVTSPQIDLNIPYRSMGGFRRRSAMLVSETVPVRDARCAASGLRGRRDRRRELPLERLWIAQEELADFPGHRIRKNLFPSVFEPVENRVRRGFWRRLHHLKRFGQVGVDRSRIDADDMDTVRREERARYLRQGMERRLAGAVGREERERHQTRERADVHDSGSRASGQHGREGLRERQRAKHVDFELVARGRDPVRIGQFAAELGHDAGVVDQQLDISGLGRSGAHFTRTGDIEAQGNDSLAGARDQVAERLGPSRGRIHAGRPACEQRLDKGAADAAVGAGDEGGRAGNLNSHGTSPSNGLNRPVGSVRRLDARRTSLYSKGMTPRRGAASRPGPSLGVEARLVATASELFYREGVRAVGIQRVIEEAGVAKASLYAHFDSKDDLG